MSDKLPRMDYRQHRRARRLVHECCNYDGGNCLLLDDGEPCVCVQSISLSLMCAGSVWLSCPLTGSWPQPFCTGGAGKRCAVCGAAFVPKSNRGKYCPDCAGRMKKIKAAGEKAETKAEMSRFRALQTRINQGFFHGVSKGARYIYPFPPETAVLNAYKRPKSTQRRNHVRQPKILLPQAERELL